MKEKSFLLVATSKKLFVFSWPGLWPHTRLLELSLWGYRTTNPLDFLGRTYL